MRALAIWLGGGAVLNYAWEMAQMPLFRVESRSTLCLRATAGDVALLALLYFTMALAAGSFDWLRAGGFARLATACMIGGWMAIAVEEASLMAGRWAYSPAMPLVPFFRVGWSPLLQLMLIPFALGVAARAADRGTAQARRPPA